MTERLKSVFLGMNVMPHATDFLRFNAAFDFIGLVQYNIWTFSVAVSANGDKSSYTLFFSQWNLSWT